MSFRADRIYLEFLRLTRRLSNQQIMMLLAVVVGVLAGLGTYLFEMLLHGIKSGLIRWFPVDSAHILFLIYPAVGIILATLFVKYIVRDNISEGVTRVLYAMSRRNSRIARHNCWTSIVGGATTIGFGGSVGPEAPIVLTGAAIGSNIGRLARLNYKHTTLLLCCGAGAALATEPLVCAVLLGIFLIEVAVTRIVSLGSIIIAALYPVGTLINLIARGANLPTILFSTICCVIMAAMVIWLHRSNIKRLKNGTEYRFGQKK